MSGHTGDTVVKDDIDRIAVVVNRVDQRIHSGMEEGRVSQYGYHTASGIAHVKGFLRAMAKADAGSHTYGGIHGFVRSSRRQRITSDIAADHNVFSLAQTVEQSTVRTSRAEGGRAADQFAVVEFDHLRFLTADGFAHHIRSHLSPFREDIFSDTLTAEHLYEILDIRIVLFQNVYFVDFAAEILDQIRGQRMGESKLQIEALSPILPSRSSSRYRKQ